MRLSRLVRGVLGANVAILVLPLVVARVGVAEGVISGVFHRWLVPVALFVAAACTLLRAAVRGGERLPWVVFGVALVSYGCGQIYYTFFLPEAAAAPVPSVADVLWLALYPAAFVGLVLLVRARLSERRVTLWLDGVVVAFGVTALAAALFLQIIERSLDGASTAAAITTLAYPTGDVILAAFTLFVFALTAWRPGRAWLMLGAGLLILAATDSAYAVAVATGSATLPDELFAGWGLGMTLLAGAAWRPARRRTSLGDERPSAAVAMVFAALSLVLLVYAGFAYVDGVAVALAAATLAVSMVRGFLLFRQAIRLAASHELAVTDPLTGLANRRKLMADLDDLSGDSLVAIFDLDGFKTYNDRFGHFEGDLLLRRVSSRFALATAGQARAYRLGGDEFCLITGDNGALDLAAQALAERGRGFSITASYGFARFPHEAATPSAALRLADIRLYERKSQGSAHLRALTATPFPDGDPYRWRRNNDVAALAAAVGRRLGLNGDRAADLVKAAELYDIGKIAIGDSILTKAGPLTEDEWLIIRGHTLVAERMVLSSTPDLANVAAILRSTREHYDGSGYPDGLAATSIPLASRIVAACSAYAAMTSARPYRATMTREQALGELQREAGSQFDARVAEALALELAARLERNQPAVEHEAREQLAEAGRRT